jgi:hypothetical protein
MTLDEIRALKIGSIICEVGITYTDLFQKTGSDNWIKLDTNFIGFHHPPGTSYTASGLTGSCCEDVTEDFHPLPRTSDGVFITPTELEEQILLNQEAFGDINIGDYSQIELMCAAHFSQEPKMLEIYKLCSTPTTCSHIWKEYKGLVEHYKYCSICDEKRIK